MGSPDFHKIIHGNCLDVMKDMPDSCIDTVITDPPYGLKFMGKDWDRGIPGVRFWSEMLRVAKPGALCLAFGGTRTYHRLVCAIEDAGWEIRDCIMWIYGSGFPKSYDIAQSIEKKITTGRARRADRDLGGRSRNRWSGDAEGRMISDTGGKLPFTTDTAKLWNGWGTALKPAYEPICVAMKPLDGTFAQNALKHGVAGLNIDGGRVKAGVDHIKNATRKGGKRSGFMVSELKAEAHLQGRWPANVIHDGSEEVVGLFPVTKGGKGPSVTKNQANDGTVAKDKQYYHETMKYGDNGSAARFFYTAKASKRERGENNNHPTVKPLALMEYLCRLTATPTEGVVLDPFLGSGTTAVAAKRSGRDFIGIDIDPGYCRIAENRLNPKDTEASEDMK